jgi:hypothetical protein
MSDIPLHLLGPYGRILASSRPDAIGLDLSDRPFFKEIASGREWFVSDLNISELTGEPEITISRGIRNADGDLLGLAVAVVELSHAAQQKESSFLSGIMETIMSVPDYQILAKLC